MSITAFIPTATTVAALVQRHAERLGLQYRSELLRPRCGQLARRRPDAGATRRSAAWHRPCAARGILTAHHADDQVETVLMRALRGSGPAGLAGMEAARRVDVVRPVLQFSGSSSRERGAATWVSNTGMTRRTKTRRTCEAGSG